VDAVAICAAPIEGRECRIHQFLRFPPPSSFSSSGVKSEVERPSLDDPSMRISFTPFEVSEIRRYDIDIPL
jgi:hypothetical protein